MVGRLAAAVIGIVMRFEAIEDRNEQVTVVRNGQATVVRNEAEIETVLVQNGSPQGKVANLVTAVMFPPENLVKCKLANREMDVSHETIVNHEKTANRVTHGLLAKAVTFVNHAMAVSVPAVNLGKFRLVNLEKGEHRVKAASLEMVANLVKPGLLVNVKRLVLKQQLVDRHASATSKNQTMMHAADAHRGWLLSSAESRHGKKPSEHCRSRHPAKITLAAPNAVAAEMVAHLAVDRLIVESRRAV